MAKKKAPPSRRKAAKSRAVLKVKVKKKKAGDAGALSVLAAQVFAECAFATAQGMERTMNAARPQRPYRVTSDARDYWLEIHTLSIPRALRRPDTNWRVDRETVLGKATKLGARAAELALADAGGAALVEVQYQHVKDASDQIRADPDCIPAEAGEGTAGAGVYCAIPS